MRRCLAVLALLLLAGSAHGLPLGGSPATGPVQLTTFQLISPNAGSQPFTIGIPLKKGAAIGSVTTNATSSQCVIKRNWNDNSNKHAICSGTQILASNVATTITVSTTSSAGGTPLTCANIAAANPNASVALSGGVFASPVTVTLSSLLASPVRTFVSGPEMVNCQYQAVTPTNNIYVSFDVRLWKSGRLWVREQVENGWLDIANNDKAYTPVLQVGGVNLYAPGAITHFANTRYSAEGWIGGDPQVTFKHNMVDVVATKLVPNFFMDTPSTAALNGLCQSYVPYDPAGGSSICGWTRVMETTGPAAQIGLMTLWDALAITSLGDSRAYASMVANTKQLGSFAIIWRASATNTIIKPSDFPTWTFFGPGPGAGGGSPGATTQGLHWEDAHFGEAGYAEYLLTGDYLGLETLQEQAAMIYLRTDAGNGSGTSRYLTGQVRAHGWFYRSLSQYTGIAPSDDPLLSDYQALLANTASTDLAHTQQVGFPPLGAFYSAFMGSSCAGCGGWDQPNGVVPGIATTAPWMHDFEMQSMGLSSDIEPLSVANMVTFNALRDFGYQWEVGRLGAAGAYCFNYGAQYGLQVSATDNTDDIRLWLADWTTVYNRTANFSGAAACANVLHGLPDAFATSVTVASPTSYWGNLLPAIAYAVDHNAPGAAAAYARFSGASNWLSFRNSGFGDFPIFGIQPRNFTGDSLASLVATMAPNTWADAGTFVTTAPTLNSVAWNCASLPCAGAPSNANLASALGNFGGITSQWAGGVWDSTNKLFAVTGGGHQVRFGNEWYGFSTATLKWSRLSVPSDITGYVTGGDSRETFPSDGQPVSNHTYDAETFDPVNGRVYSVRNCGESLGGCGGSQAGSDGFSISLAGLSPTQFNNWVAIAVLPGTFGVGTMAHFDPTSGKIFAWGNSATLNAYTVGSPGSWADLGGTGQVSSTGQTGALQPGSQMIAAGNGLLKAVSLSTGNILASSPGAGSDLTCVNKIYPGHQWDSTSSKSVLWCGGTTVYLVNPATYVVTAHTVAPSNTVVPQCSIVDVNDCESTTGQQTNGTHGRWQYLPAYNVFMLVNSPADHVYVYKPDF